ncbi:hypothetical protein ACHAPT_005353 [Fusarium lateritium]
MVNKFPNEVLSNIFGHLTTRAQKHRLHNDHLTEIWPIRLVCRRWNAIATNQLFKTLTLYHGEEAAEGGFRSWQYLLNSDAIRDAARRVAIESAPPNNTDGEFGEVENTVWESWLDDGEWPEFTSAIDRIRDLPHLNALEVRFSEHCFPDQASGLIVPETTFTRENTLKRILKAMRRREAGPNMSVLRELVLENLQNTPLREKLTDCLFQNIERLHILIAFEQEDDEEDIPEVSKYGRYLQNRLIPSVAEQLVELTLAAQDYWGAINDEFDGTGLHFPRLKALTLASYVITRHDQLDWVLRQESLISLQLHGCAIASHILVLQPEFADWGVDLPGWKWVNDPPSHGFDFPPMDPHADPGENLLTPGFYVYSLRWDTIFDNIGARLPRLQNFKFTSEPWGTFFRHDGRPNGGALVNRYIAFNEYWRELVFAWLQECSYVEENRLGTPEEILTLTEDTDRRALETLLQTTRERQQRVN